MIIAYQSAYGYHHSRRGSFETLLYGPDIYIHKIHKINTYKYIRQENKRCEMVNRASHSPVRQSLVTFPSRGTTSWCRYFHLSWTFNCSLSCISLSLVVYTHRFTTYIFSYNAYSVHVSKRTIYIYIYMNHDT